MPRKIKIKGIEEDNPLLIKNHKRSIQGSSSETFVKSPILSDPPAGNAMLFRLTKQ